MTIRLLLLWAALAAAAFDPAAVRADDPAHPTADAGTAEKGHDEHKPEAGKTSGLTRYDLGLWTLIVFGLLFFLLSKVAWKPIMQGLQKREETIASHHTAAESARGEAQKLLDEVRAQKARAGEEIAAMLAQARREADAFREVEKARTAADVQAERERLKREIDTARDQALQDIWARTVELAALVSSKAVRRELSADDHRRLIDEALVELKQTVGKAS
jgi:F-type H+-transporting ATPase subunit b